MVEEKKSGLPADIKENLSNLSKRLKVAPKILVDEPKKIISEDDRVFFSKFWYLGFVNIRKLSMIIFFKFLRYLCIVWHLKDSIDFLFLSISYLSTLLQLWTYQISASF